MRSKNACRAHASISSSVTGFDDAGARMLAGDLARARSQRMELAIQRPEKLVAALEAAVAQGKAGGEGAWLLSLELLQWQHEQAKFDERAVEFAVDIRSVAAVVGAAAARGRQGAAARAAVGVRRCRGAPRARVAGPGELVWDGVLAGRNATAARAASPIRASRSPCADRHDGGRAHRFHLRRRAAQRDQPDREPGQGGADHRRDADRPRAAAADRHIAAPLRQESRTDALPDASDGDLSRHDDPVGSPRRRRRAGRRRPGDARATSSSRRPRARCGGSITTGCWPDSPARRPTRSRCSSASRPSSKSTRDNSTRAAVELAKDWRSDRVLRRLEAMLAIADRSGVARHHRHGRRARAGARHRRDRLGRTVCAGRGARRCSTTRRCRAREIVERALTIAGEICIYTNQQLVIESLTLA